jgi:hypothetical protein
LKDMQGAMRAVGAPHEIRPELNEVERIVGSEAG